VATNPAPTAPDGQIRAGERCLLVLMGHRYLATIVSADEEHVRTTFPTCDFPLTGMHIDLALHDEAGYTSYPLEVLEPPAQPGDGLLMRRPEQLYRMHHRGTWRVPADFRVELRDQVHPRRIAAPVINVSAGGMLLRLPLDVEAGDNLDVWLALPGAEETHQMVARVAHVSRLGHQSDEAVLVGLSFVSPDPYAVRDLKGYVWRRLRELYPNYMGPARREADGSTE